MVADVTKSRYPQQAVATPAARSDDALVLANFYEANRALTDAVSHLELIADSLPVLVSYIDAQHRYRFVNVGYETWFGCPRGEATGKHLSEVLGQAAYDRIRPHVERALTGETVSYEAEVPYEHGGTRFIDATYIPHRDQHGRIAGLAALVSDISERKRRENAMAELHRENDAARIRAEQLYRFAAAVVTAERVEQVFDAALDAIERAMGASRSSILVFDTEGVMRFRAWRNLTDGYRAAVEGHSPWSRDTVAPEPVLIPDARLDPAMEPYAELFEREEIRALGFIPLVAGGRLLGKFMVYYDQPHPLSEQELELASTIANHLAAAVVRFDAVAKLKDAVRYHELFAGVLAHDLRNPLTAIVTAANVMLMRLEGAGDKVSKPLNRILTSGERMARMISQLLDFTRARLGGGFELHRIGENMARLCETAVSEIELAHPEWTITRELEGNLTGSWDCDRMLQVVSNLVANAGQHGEAGSPIALRLDGTHPHEVVIEIRNRGTIPSHVIGELFDPFRRAQRQSPSNGLGLGLFITREIVEAHGGKVSVESSDAAGTVFRAVLPRTAP